MLQPRELISNEQLHALAGDSTLRSLCPMEVGDSYPRIRDPI